MESPWGSISNTTNGLDLVTTLGATLRCLAIWNFHTVHSFAYGVRSTGTCIMTMGLPVSGPLVYRLGYRLGDGMDGIGELQPSARGAVLFMARFGWIGSSSHVRRAGMRLFPDNEDSVQCRQTVRAQFRELG